MERQTLKGCWEKKMAKDAIVHHSKSPLTAIFEKKNYLPILFTYFWTSYHIAPLSAAVVTETKSWVESESLSTSTCVSTSLNLKHVQTFVVEWFIKRDVFLHVELPQCPHESTHLVGSCYSNGTCDCIDQHYLNIGPTKLQKSDYGGEWVLNAVDLYSKI